MTARPNQDLGAAIRASGVTGAVHGLGSLVRPCFADGRTLNSPATEILLTQGRAGADGVSLAADAVGLDGRLHSGPLAPDRNGICVTAELLILGAD